MLKCMKNAYGDLNRFAGRGGGVGTNVSATEQDDGLPDWHVLEAAFFSGSPANAHPVALYAYRLGRLHRQRCAVPGMAVTRRQAISAIDAWATEHVHESTRVPSLGAYIDQMAMSFVRAYEVLRSCESVGDAVHAAVVDAAEWATGWTEIVLNSAPLAYNERWRVSYP